MKVDWDTSELTEQLSLHQIVVAPDMESLFGSLNFPSESDARLTFEIEGLELYALRWGVKAGVWIVLSVVQMLKDILKDYGDKAVFGCVPPTMFGVLTLEDFQQEIGHRCVTAYQEIYDILVRTHRKPSSPIWHRRAIVEHFPQLILEVTTTGSEFNEDRGE